MKVELTMDEFRASYDWEYIFEHFIRPTAVLGDRSATDSFSREDVAEIVALVEGENDGDEWVGVFLLKDGRYAAIAAGCDYTGWGCQDGGSTEVASDLGGILYLGLTDEQRRRMEIELPK